MTPTTLSIRLLGGFQLADGDALLTRVNTARLQSLLAYLVLHAGSAQLRQHIAFRLWPDTLESHARNNLRQALHQLRQAIPDAERFLSADASTVTWHTNTDQFIDVMQFEQAMAMADAAERQGDQAGLQRALEEAASLYQGDLLPACYDEWIAPKREWLREQYRHTCRKLALLLESRNEVGRALQMAEQLLHLDPLDEDTYILLLRLHGLTGDQSSARRVYQDAIERLKQELDAEPSEALRQAYERVQRTSPQAHLSRSGAPMPSTAPALIGRLGEWQQLLSAWRRATQGERHLVLVTGEAGVGKSRLAEELFHWVKQEGSAAAYTRSYAAEGRLSLAPITDWLRSEALSPALNALDDLWLTEVARLLPELLTEHRTLSRPEPIGEYGQRQRFFEALARAVAAVPRPLLLWIDDLQWCDSETLEWLHFLLRFAPRSHLLLLGTARSEESPAEHPLSVLARQLRAEGKLTTLELAPLDAAETARLASQIEGHELDMAASVRLYHETEGNPLFVVEAVRAGIGGAAAADASAPVESLLTNTSTLPPRVYAVIAGRLAQLSADARSVAELSAALGRALTLGLLLQAGNLNEESAIRQAMPPAIDVAGPIPFPVLQSLFDGLYPAGLQWYWRADFFNKYDDKAIALHVKYGSQLPTMHSTMHIYPINGAVGRVGKGDTAWSYRDANFAQVIVGVDPDPANNERTTAWAKDYWLALHPASAGGGYLNMMMDEGEERIKAAYRENYTRLSQVKAKYDPHNLFHVNQNIKPA